MWHHVAAASSFSPLIVSAGVASLVVSVSGLGLGYPQSVRNVRLEPGGLGCAVSQAGPPASGTVQIPSVDLSSSADNSVLDVTLPSSGGLATNVRSWSVCIDFVANPATGQYAMVSSTPLLTVLLDSITPVFLFIDGLTKSLTSSGSMLDATRDMYRIVPRAAACSDTSLSVGSVTTLALGATNSSQPLMLTVSPNALVVAGTTLYRVCVQFGVSSEFMDFSGTSGYIELVPLTLTVGNSGPWYVPSFNYTIQWTASDGITAVQVELQDALGTTLQVYSSAVNTVPGSSNFLTVVSPSSSSLVGSGYTVAVFNVPTGMIVARSLPFSIMRSVFPLYFECAECVSELMLSCIP